MIYSQRDPQWKDEILGTKGKIGDYGCTITSIGYLADLTPHEVNERLKKVNGYANGNLIIWTKIKEAIPWLEFEWRGYAYENDKVSANLPCLVEVDGKAIGGTGKHWVVFTGNKKSQDPWTGTERPTSDWIATGYSIIKKVGDKPQEVTTSDNLQTEINQKNDQISNLQGQVDGLLKDIEALKGELSEEKTKSSTLNGRTQELIKQVDELEDKLGTANGNIKALTTKIESQTTIIAEYNKEDAVQISDLKDAQEKADEYADRYFEFIRTVRDMLKLGGAIVDTDEAESECVGALQSLIDSKVKELKINHYRIYIKLGDKILWRIK